MPSQSHKRLNESDQYIPKFGFSADRNNNLDMACFLDRSSPSSMRSQCPPAGRNFVKGLFRSLVLVGIASCLNLLGLVRRLSCFRFGYFLSGAVNLRILKRLAKLFFHIFFKNLGF